MASITTTVIIVTSNVITAITTIITGIF